MSWVWEIRYHRDRAQGARSNLINFLKALLSSRQRQQSIKIVSFHLTKIVTMIKDHQKMKKLVMKDLDKLLAKFRLGQHKERISSTKISKRRSKGHLWAKVEFQIERMQVSQAKKLEIKITSKVT